MAIKPNQLLTKEDFEAALVTLRLSVSEVSRESGIPRHIVSHFRSYGDGLKPEQAAKLRDFLESKGIEFTEETSTQQTATASPTAVSQGIHLPFTMADDGLTQRTALVCRHFFIDERITDEQIVEAGERITESFTSAKELMDIELVSTWRGNSYDEATETKLRELWGHLARIGLVSLHMQGRVLIDQDRAGSLSDTSKPKPKTFGDLLTLTYREAVAGLNDYGQSAETAAEDNTEEETA